jgi:hypothetical protein
MNAKDKEFVADRIKELQEEFKNGMDIYCVLRHVSKSGMMRAISCFYIKNNVPICLDYSIQKICDYKFNRLHGGLTVTGCGMDMGFHLVNCLEYKLFGHPSNRLHTRWI